MCMLLKHFNRRITPSLGKREANCLFLERHHTPFIGTLRKMCKMLMIHFLDIFFLNIIQTVNVILPCLLKSGINGFFLISMDEFQAYEFWYPLHSESAQ